MRTADLASTYKSKTDDELLILGQSDGLTAEAQFVVLNELKRRGIDINLAVSDPRESGSTDLGELPKPILQTVHSLTDFTAAVTHIYRDHFVIFFKLTVPAVAISYVAFTFARQEGGELLRQFFRETSHNRDLILLKVGLIIESWQLLAGLASCVSFAAICSAVGHIRSDSVPKVGECLSSVSNRIASLLKLSLLYLVLVWLAIRLGMLSIAAYYRFLRYMRLDSMWIQAVALIVMCLGFLLISRLALAMPAVVLDNYKVSAAIFRSDELTEGKWLTLAVLLLKSVAGGYVAAMLPFWIGTLIWGYVQLPGWFLTLSSYLGVTLVEPFMFIGFALLYVRMSSKPIAPTSEDFVSAPFRA